MIFMSFESTIVFLLTLMHSKRPKLYTILAFLSATAVLESQENKLVAQICYFGPLKFLF